MFSAVVLIVFSHTSVLININKNKYFDIRLKTKETYGEFIDKQLELLEIAYAASSKKKSAAPSQSQSWKHMHTYIHTHAFMSFICVCNVLYPLQYLCLYTDQLIN